MSNDFYLKVHEVVKRIPLGRVSTYGAIARHLGAGRSSRMVGYALRGVFDEMSIPCHRVVNRNGELSGKVHFPTPTFMREMLESEGILFTGDRVDMERHFWDPSDEPEPTGASAGPAATSTKRSACRSTRPGGTSGEAPGEAPGETPGETPGATPSKRSDGKAAGKLTEKPTGRPAGTSVGRPRKNPGGDQAGGRRRRRG